MPYCLCKEPTCQCRRGKRHGLSPWLQKIPWWRAWQPTPVFLIGKSHGHRSLVGGSPRSHKESGTTEWLLLTHSLYCTEETNNIIKQLSSNWKINMELLCDMVILLLGIYPKEVKAGTQTDICIHTHIHSISIPKSWKAETIQITIGWMDKQNVVYIYMCGILFSLKKQEKHQYSILTHIYGI